MSRLERVAGRNSFHFIVLLDEIGSEVQDHRRFPLTCVSHFILFQISNQVFRGLCKIPVRCEQKQQIFTVSVILPSFKHCLMPGDVIMHTENVPGNARRIFAGIDIQAPIDDVWRILTDYEELEAAVPNLVENTVLDRWSTGCRLRQVGSAELIPGLRFSALMTVDVETHPNGIPSEQCGRPTDYDSSPRSKLPKGPPLTRGVFPSPYALEDLPVRDISMQSVEGQPGDFSHYQGVWRLQPLPGCETVDGGAAMRLTYAVELRPRICVPVKLLERRIAVDLGKNLMAIRDFAESRKAPLLVPNVA